MRFRFISLLLPLAMTATLYAQTPTGTIQGRVTDPSDAEIANASVTITNNGTNEERTATTDASGHYAFPFQTPGTYTVVVSAPSFRQSRVENVALEVGQTRAVDVTLSLGAVT